MAMLLRFSPSEGVLRSVGDPPNGILGVACPNDIATFVIDTAWLPDVPPPPSHLRVENEQVDGGISDASTPISLADALDACESDYELNWLLRAPALALAGAAQINAQRPVPFEVLFLQSHVDLVEAMRDELIDRGKLKYTDG